jgi:hypothetical protein
MLNSFANFVDTFAAAAAPWDPASLNPVPVVVPNPLMTPEEPSALALTIIGLGIVCLYAGVKRWRRRQEGSQMRHALDANQNVTRRDAA